MRMSNFIQKLLHRTDSAMSGDVIYTESDYHEPVQIDPPREVFAVEKLHGVVGGTIDKLRNDEQQLVAEINYRMEKLRQVRVSLRAVGAAYEVLDADLQNPQADPPMPQT